MNEWYYVERGERQGPVDHHGLATRIGRGELPADVLVWRDGMEDWASANSVAELSAPAAGIREATRDVPEERHRGEVGFDPFSQEHYGDRVITYAGFWKRFVAYFIDSLILQAVGFVLQFVVLVLAAIPGAQDNEAVMLGLGLFLSLLSMAIFLLYFAAFESGSWQATPGKKVLGIKVTDLYGRRITFARALGRNLGKIVSGLILGIGYMMAGFTEKKQALHDMMAGCLVING